MGWFGSRPSNTFTGMHRTPWQSSVCKLGTVTLQIGHFPCHCHSVMKESLLFNWMIKYGTVIALIFCNKMSILSFIKCSSLRDNFGKWQPPLGLSQAVMWLLHELGPHIYVSHLLVMLPGALTLTDPTHALFVSPPGDRYSLLVCVVCVREALWDVTLYCWLPSVGPCGFQDFFRVGTCNFLSLFIRIYCISRHQRHWCWGCTPILTLQNFEKKKL